MATTIITKNGSGAPTADDLSVGELAVDLTNKRLYSKNSSSEVIELGVNAAADTTFGDNVKAIFGDGSDLQIYHDASDSIINDNGTGSLKLQQGGSTKLEVTTTGIDVTGTVTADGLTVDGTTATIQDDSANLRFENSAGTRTGYIQNRADAFEIWNDQATFMSFGTNNTEAMRITSAGQTQVVGYDAMTLGFPAIAGGASRSGIKPTVTGAGAGQLQFLVGGDNNTEATTIAAMMDASGNVGIGTASPGSSVNYKTLTINGTTGGIVEFHTGAALQSYILGNSSELRLQTNSSQVLTFNTNGTERMRIDSSGNLLVGGTSAFADDSTTINSSGLVYASRAGNKSGHFNRQASDGEIVNFSKDGTTVGSIVTSGGDLAIGTGNTKLRFNDASDAIYSGGGDGSGTNAGTDLGTSDYKFGDLYLSGGAYLGGTGSANKLDDYEEGTWTPTLAVNGFSASATLSSATGVYTKIGNLVYINAEIVMSGQTYPSSYCQITGIPFTGSYSMSSAGVYDGVNPSSGTQGGSASGGATGLFLTPMGTTTTSTTWRISIVLTTA